MPNRFCNFLILGSALTFSAGLRGQTSSTEILGLVSDSSGAVVPGAKVTITRLATRETRTAVTNEAGEYTFPLIEIGEYWVHVEKGGFRSQTVTGLRVELQQKARVDFTLEVGSVSETVEVAARAVALQTEDAAIGQVIENKRVVELPLNGRNITMLAVMTPGAQFGSRTGNSDGQGGYPIPGQGISVIANGQREIHQSVSLDGVEAIMPLYNHTAWTPSIDAIEEFKVQTGSYSAEYGQGAGAHIQVSIKSGTNQLRGTIFEFLRNDKLDAENYFLNFEQPPGAQRLQKDRLRRNQFGTFLAGPIIRNKTFWSFNYEGRRQTKEGVDTVWWPNADFRRGDFSALLRPAVNPATGRLFRAPIVIYDPLTGDPFENNVIPRSRLHAGAQNVVAKYLPPPDFQQADILDFDVRRPVSQPITGNQFFGRVDHNVSSFDKVFGRIAIDRADWEANSINPNFPESRQSHAYNLATQWVHTFSQNMLNEFRFGINNWSDDFINPRTNTDFDPDSLGIGKFRVAGDGNRKLKPLETGVPLVGFGIGDNQGRVDDTNTYQFADNLSIIRGKHNFKMGSQYSYVMMDRLAANLTRGRLTFGAQETGFALSSLLLGYPNRAETAEGYPATGLRANRVGAYFTDDWKVTPQVTLNLGFRWDYYGNPVDNLGNLRTIDFVRTFTTPDGSAIPTLFPSKPGSDAAKTKLFEQGPGFFMPRLGIAYRPATKWVFRAGAGWFSSSQLLVNYSILNLHPPLSGSEQYNAVTDPAKRIPITVSDQSFTIQTRQFRAGAPVLTLDDPFTGPRGSRPVNVLHIQPNHRNSDVWQWSFDFQRELPNQTSLTIGYVGSKNTHVANSIGNFNAADPSPNTNFQPRRPFPKFFDPATPERGIQDVGSIRYLDSYGNGFYHGLQLKIDRRYGKGFSYGLAYTFSKALGEGENGGNENALQQNPLDRRGSRARYSFDQTQSAVLHWVWEIPFGRNLSGLPAGMLKGWQTNWATTDDCQAPGADSSGPPRASARAPLRSGFPFTPTVGSGDLNTGDSDAKARMIYQEQTLYRTRPDWSRDGKRIIYSSHLGGQFNNLFVLPAGGGEPYKMTFGEWDAFHPRWSPDGEWIVYVANQEGLPELRLLRTYGGKQIKMAIRDKRWRRPMGRANIRIEDEHTRQPLPSRVYLRASDQKAYAPDDAFALIGRLGEHLFHSPGTVILDVPAGEMRVEAMRGFQYSPASQNLKIEAGKTTFATISLRRISDLTGKGWYSGGNHVHMNYGGNLHNTPKRLMAMAAAEDLDVIAALVANKDNRIFDYQHFTGDVHPISDGRRILFFNEEYRPPFYGHVSLINLRKHLISPFTTGYEGTAIESLYPSNTDMLRAAAEEGALGAYVHPFSGTADPLDSHLGGAKTFPVDVALGTVVYHELMTQANEAGLHVWHHALNNGFHITAVGGEDSITNMHRRALIGQNRAFGYIGPKLTWEGWIDAIRKGRMFVTNGPLVEFDVNGQISGEEVRLPYPQATTNPVWVLIDDKPVRSAESAHYFRPNRTR